MPYLPEPSRVWSRVQSNCTYVNSYNNDNLVLFPLTGQTLPLEEINSLIKIYEKGNILQYKNNSSNLTKKQKYSQIAKGLWQNRTKSWATQTQTYSNPNNSSLKRINYSTLAITNNNSYILNTYSVPSNPFNCGTDNSLNILDGGTLVCNQIVNPCTNQVVEQTTSTNCSLSTCSNVPGKPVTLCWNSGFPTYYPKKRYFMNNSTNKWPQGYKGFVSACKPSSALLFV